MDYPNMSYMNLSVRRITVVLSVVFFVFAIRAAAQDLPPTSANVQNIPAGSYVIPMDNVLQGNAGGTTFNLQAYGLANRLLQNGIPLLWAIKSGKVKDAIDFTAAASKIVPSAQASASRNFSGGPFIVHPSFTAAALPFITAYGNSVAVFQLTNNEVVDVRYTLTHKPLIAVGLANGSNSTIHKNVYNAAGIPNYIDYDDAIVNETSCVTVITQPHVETTTFVPGYRLFGLSGGNLLFQCRAIETYENAAAGHFQTSLGWTLDNHNDSDLLYPNADMPFSQFVGIVDGNQSGYETDYTLASGSLVNGAFINVTNRDFANDHVATTSKIYNAGPGGMVFELGGHDYRTGGTPFSIGDLNGMRMLLNAVFVPPTRPAACGINLGFPLVDGYKFVRLTNNVFPFNMGAGDTLTWTIVYINRGSLGTTSFQINEVLPAGLTLTGTGAQTVTVSGGATATKNTGFTGANPNQGLLAAGATLPVNGKITVTVPTTINAGFVGTYLNQPNASGSNVPVAGVNTDNIDNSSVIVFAGGDIIPPVGSIVQTQGATVDPTSVTIFAPTAAAVSISGRVTTSAGRGISKVRVTITDENGATRMALTNSFGYYRFDGVETGQTYVITPVSKLYQFRSRVISITDSLADLDFSALE